MRYLIFRNASQGGKEKFLLIIDNVPFWNYYKVTKESTIDIGKGNFYSLATPEYLLTLGNIRIIK